jgi:hypothetical protein
MGGQPEPASGFALYLDPVLKLARAVDSQGGESTRISLKFDSASTATGFSLAKALREAGLIVKLHLGGKGPTDTAWLVEVREGAAPLLLTDLRTKHRRQFHNSQELLSALQA